MVPRRAPRGFTLLELLTAMVIMGLALSVVMPLSQASLERTQSRVELSRLAQLFKNASRRAFIEGAKVTVSVGDERVILEGGSAAARFELKHHRPETPVAFYYDRWGMASAPALRLRNPRTQGEVVVDTQ